MSILKDAKFWLEFGPDLSKERIKRALRSCGRSRWHEVLRRSH
jgi:hypothetical protein